MNDRPVSPKRGYSRRAAIRLLALSGAGALAPGLAHAASASNAPASNAPPGAAPAAGPAAPTPSSVAASEYAAAPVPTDAIGGHAGSLAAVTGAVNGAGLYVGNEFKAWSDTDRQKAFAAAARWGFSFLCPKVGGYGKTWYTDAAQLASWNKMAQAEGIKLVPFIYTIPSTAVGDGAISAVIASTCGIVVVDMEDEWGSDEKNPSGTKQGYQGAAMTAFGARYRQDAPRLPVVVTGYGDPITRFGRASWPYLEMQSWADAYSPQFYYGVYSRFYNDSVEDAVQWGADECAAVFHPTFPVLPSFSIYSAWSKSGILSPADLKAGRKVGRAWPGPLFWWEYTDMTDTVVAAILV